MLSSGRRRSLSASFARAWSRGTMASTAARMSLAFAVMRRCSEAVPIEPAADGRDGGRQQVRTLDVVVVRAVDLHELLVGGGDGVEQALRVARRAREIGAVV